MAKDSIKCIATGIESLIFNPFSVSNPIYVDTSALTCKFLSVFYSIKGPINWLALYIVVITDKIRYLFFQTIYRVKFSVFDYFSFQCPKPIFNLVHPRTVFGGKTKPDFMFFVFQEPHSAFL